MKAQRQSADATQEASVPNDKQHVSQLGHATQPLNRRRALRVLGSLAAAAAGAAVLNAALPEKASAYVQTEPSTQFTGPIASTGGNGTTPLGATIVGTNPNNGYAIYGTTNAGGITAAVYGLSTGEGTGVFGECNNGIAAVGVQGHSDTGTGVLASGAQYGVWGQAQTSGALGVYGTHLSGGTAILGQSRSGIGVQGTSGSSSNTSPGVYGVNTGGGPAIVGQATGSGFGFSAVTQTGTGCFGGASGAGGTGMYAFSAPGTALTAQALGAGAYAGYFSGSVAITEALTVMGAKSAAVRAADGKLRRMYSLESPESWFEDFGKGGLKSGSATIQLEPGFAGVVHGDDYHVFLTPRGESKWLYVSKQTPGGFTVQEGDGGTSNIGFSYRVVAKRKDIAGARLEQVDEPPTLEVPAFPKLPAVPPEPVAPRRPGPER